MKNVEALSNKDTNDLPRFVPGATIYADDLNALVATIKELWEHIAILEQAHEKNKPRQPHTV